MLSPWFYTLILLFAVRLPLSNYGPSSSPSLIFATDSQRPTVDSQLGRSAPAYSTTDIEGHPRSQDDERGRGAVLYFFCGCEPCHQVARLWSQIQHGSALPKDGAGKPISTTVFFFGEQDGARAFAQETGLDLAQTSLVADPAMEVGHRYGVDACPRAFVVDADGRIAYTNAAKDDRAQSGSATVIVSRIVQAVRDRVKGGSKKGPQVASIEREAAGGLVAVAERGDEVVSPVQVIRHLGEFDRERSAPVEQLLILKNRGQQPVQIAQVEGSCGCTDILLFAGDRRLVPGRKPLPGRFPDADAKHSLTLAPGAVATLRVRLNVGQVEAGRHRKYAWVLLPGSDAAAVTLCLDFVVRSAVSAGTRRVEFGLVNAGEGRTVPFTLSLDEGRYVPSRPPAVTSTNPYITAKPAGGVATTIQEGKSVVQITYNVSISPRASLGNIAGSLLVKSTESTMSTKSTKSTKSTNSTWVLAALGGEVVGEVRALPGTILFGAVDKGQERRQQGTLLLQRPEIRSGLRVATSAPWLQARVVDPKGEQKGGEGGILGPYALLDVVLTPQAPPGPIEANITITTASGQKLVLTALATVKP